MSVVARCGSVALLLCLLVGIAPAMAQTPQGEGSSSSWTDPPARGAGAPDAPVVAKPPEVKAAEPTPPAAAEAPADAASAKPTRAAAAPPPTPAERASTVLGVKPVAGGQSAARSQPFIASGRPAVRPRFDVGSQTIRARAYRPRFAERAVRPRPIVERQRPAVDRPSRRLAIASSRGRGYRSYAWIPNSRSYGRVDPYDGRDDARSWAPRRLAGWNGLLGDGRANRIAQARSSGYAVMRLRTYAYPDGTQVQRLVPFDAESAFGGSD